MAKLPTEAEMYEAVTRSDREYDGVFVVAVKTTKIFCRPTCPARTPLRQNVEFFAGPREALYAGYRPCKRCRPLEPAGKSPEWVRSAISLVESRPHERVRDSDLRRIEVSPERIRRYFQSNFGMTFHAYARGRRLGEALARIRDGRDVIEVAMDSGFESTSGFREAFHRAFGAAPSRAGGLRPLAIKWIETPLGSMIAAADAERLYLLEFSDRRMLAHQIDRLRRILACDFVPGTNEILEGLERELSQYFQGELRRFATPIALTGTEFQVGVWRQLLQIPYGETLSYSDLGRKLGVEEGARAIGRANGDNRIAILIPCHRVIRADGTLCGYGGGLWRKQRLLELESGQISLL